MKNEHENLYSQRQVAIITNNIHCERHVQYFSTIEKYFHLNGWEVRDDFEVDLIVICGCGFHDAMYEKVKRALAEVQSQDFLEKNIVVMACLPKTHQQELERNFNGLVVPIGSEHMLDERIGAGLQFKDVDLVNVFLKSEKCAEVDADDHRFYVKISQGCLKECTFCVINKAKGYIKSVPLDDIVLQVRRAVEMGRKNIFLMGEDTFAYGIDCGTDIVHLVETLKGMFPDVNLYFGYLHIRWLAKYATSILEFCKKGWLHELHIGLQHVNETMLAAMGRPVKFAEVYEIIETIRRECPGFYMVADIMVGFPGETDAYFNELIEFFKKDTCFDKVKHFGYSAVEGAPSAQYDGQIDEGTVAARWDILDDVLGERSYSVQDNESRLDNETFRVTRFEDYSFCRLSFDPAIEGVGERAAVAKRSAAAPVLGKEKDGDFNF